MLKVKIITKNEAIKLGLANRNTIQNGGGVQQFMYGVVGKKDDKDDKGNDIVHEHFKVDIKTNKKDILFETKEYKNKKKNLKINEYKEVVKQEKENK